MVINNRRYYKWRTISLISIIHHTKHNYYNLFYDQDHENFKDTQYDKFQGSSRQEHHDTSLDPVSDNYCSRSSWDLLRFRIRRPPNIFCLHFDILSWDVRSTFPVLHLLDLGRFRQFEPIWLCSDRRWPGRLPGQVYTKARCSLNCWNSLCCRQRHQQFRARPNQLRILLKPTVTSFYTLGESQSRQ